MENQEIRLRHRRSTVFILEDEEENEIKQDSPTNQNPAPEANNPAPFRSAIAFTDPTAQYLFELEAQGEQETATSEHNPSSTQDLTSQSIPSPAAKQDNIQQRAPNHQLEEEIFQRSSTRKGEQIKNMIHPQSKLLKQVLKSNNFSIDELEGEAFLHMGNVCIQSESCNQKGKLLITNYRFAFFIGSKLKVDVALGYIERLSTREDRSSVILQIYLKHSPIWKFKYENKKEGEDADNLLELYAFPSKITYFFAFSHYKSILKKPEPGNYYSFQKEFSRMGMLQNPKFKKIDNFDGSICSTYPNQLLVPCDATEQLIRFVAKARDRERFPVATYSIKNNNVTYTLWRSSQLKCADNKSFNDILYINMLSWSPLIIVQARTKQSARESIETPDLYKQTIVEYLNLDPIPAVKTSYYRMIQACMGSEPKKFIKEVNQSKWYDQIKNLLIGATLICESLIGEKNVLVHCGDGWDRTSQLCALSLLLIDPYFRTIDGFAVLIEKEFISFGDPFYLRLGLRGRSEEQIPIFIQFLDCVTQIMSQYPLSFQFTIKYITLLSNYIYTNRFGNFLSSSKSELYQFKVRENTLSIWEELKKDPLTVSPFYLNSSEIGIYSLQLNLESKSIRHWKEHFFYLTTNLRDSYRMHPFAEDNHDYLKLLHDQLKLNTDSLRKKVSEQFKFMMALKEQLDSINNSPILLEEIE